jgi:flagellar basal body-associated protein FliL
MAKRFLAAALAVTLMLGVLAGCYRERPQEPFSGAGDTPFSVGEGFTINLTAESEDQRRFKYVVCSVTLEVSEAGVKAGTIRHFDSRLHRIQEIVIDAISSKTVDQLSSIAQKDALREEIRDKVNIEFNTTAVNRVVFGTFYFH